MSYQTLLFEVTDGVAEIRLNRPEAAHSINLQMAEELASVSLRCDEDPEIRAVLISSSGKMFCSGGDLGSFSEAGDSVPALLKEITAPLHTALSRFARMAKPVIVAVNGTAAGAGFSLVCAADLAIAAESARFTMAYTNAGLTPDGSATYSLPRLVGHRKALELMMTNRLLSATEALEWGIVNLVVGDECLQEESVKLAQKLAAGPTRAFGVVKELLLASDGNSLETQMELEARGISDSSRTEDAKEGMVAFFEKRKPVFQGK